MTEISATSVAPDGHDAQDNFVSAVKGMLARPDYLVPLAAAERQFRDHYYGLNSAALLEDLFFDALGSFLRQTAPTAKLTRPPTGQKGWDYAFDGLQISHKVSQTLGDVAALWDATKTGVTEWSFDEPIVYVLGANSPATSVSLGLGIDSVIAARSVASLPPPYVGDGRTIFVVKWPTMSRQPEILEVIATGPGQTVKDALPFSVLWTHMAGHVAAGGAANEIDVLISSRKLEHSDPPTSESSRKNDVDIAVELRGGAYLLRRELLQNLPVTTNNRAILIPRATIKQLLQEASSRDLFAPLPLWYWVYAQERPPDMYSAQRAEYDARFSARGTLDA